MKKLLLSLTLLCTLSAQAEVSPLANKTINIVIPNAPASGYTPIFLMMQQYAAAQKISLRPVYKPGAEGKIGIDYAAASPAGGNSILMSTVSDMTHNKAAGKFDPVTNISAAELVLVASKKSNIKHINDIVTAPADKFNVAYSSTAQLTLIDTIINHYGLDKSKMNIVAYTPSKGVPIQLSLLSGDVDFGYVLHTSSKQFIEDGELIIVEMDSAIKAKIDAKANTVALFLPKNTEPGADKLWEKFISGFLEDAVTKQKFQTMGIRSLPVGKDNLVKVLDSWAN